MLRDIASSEGRANYSNEDLNAIPERRLVVRSSLKSRLPPTLIIKSSNLRVLDPIGQGINLT